MSNEKGIILHRREEQEVLNNISSVPLRSMTKLETERLATHENGVILLRDIIFRPRTKVKLSEIVQGDYNPTNDLLMVIDDLAPEYNEIYITDFDNQLSTDRPEGITEAEASILFMEKQDTSGMIRRDGTNDLDSAYVPIEDMDVVSKKYIDDQDFVRVDTPVMNNGYSPIEDFQVYTTDDITGELIFRLPENPGEVGTLWNDDGVIKYVDSVTHVRYYTQSNMVFRTLVLTQNGWVFQQHNESPTNGYIDIISNAQVLPLTGMDTVTKGEVLHHGLRETWVELFRLCINMTEFVVSATDESLVTDYGHAWSGCRSLTSFPFIDTSKGTNFSAAWYGCSSLTSFPTLDTSKGTNFKSAWSSCAELTSFPLIDTSKGTDFEYAWADCTELTSFPFIDTSKGIIFNYAWTRCLGLTAFPYINVSSGTEFRYTWSWCFSLGCPIGPNKVVIPQGADTEGICRET